MSARAIRALRGESNRIPFVDRTEISHEEEDSEDETKSGTELPIRASAFARMEDSDEDDEEDDADEEAIERIDLTSKDRPTEFTLKAKDSNDSEDETEEDLDALLDEFKERDFLGSSQEDTGIDESATESSPFEHILSGIDIRDLDIDYSTRTSFLPAAASAATSLPQTPTNTGRKNRKAFFFGVARDGWVRPPNFVGGGIGMDTYDGREQQRLPWPYNIHPSFLENDRSGSGRTMKFEFFTFVHSDNYRNELADYQQIQQSGDLNALVMFVRHHPFVTDALLQLSLVLYQTNHSQEGLLLLRRCLWIYECSSLLRFARGLEGCCLMDADQPENSIYFKALFRLVQVSHRATLPRTALAVSRFILSLDPLRDPTGVLLSIDYHALASNAVSSDRWLVDLIDSGVVLLWYREDSALDKLLNADLRNLPNMAYSYALALFRLHSDSPSEESFEKANHAIQAAMSQFPEIVGLLLQRNEVDISGRSFRRDWITVLDLASERSRSLRNEWLSTVNDGAIVVAATLQACDLITKIFVETSAKLWSDDGVQQWVFDNMKMLYSRRLDFLEVPESLSPALIRYISCDPSDYESHLPLLPQDANVVDVNLIALAMDINPNLPRLLRRMPPMDNGAGQLEGHRLHDGFSAAQPLLGGPPSQMIDPDWPIVEVFWRSFLPWTHVDGVIPPRR